MRNLALLLATLTVATAAPARAECTVVDPAHQQLCATPALPNGGLPPRGQKLECVTKGASLVIEEDKPAFGQALVNGSVVDFSQHEYPLKATEPADTLVVKTYFHPYFEINLRAEASLARQAFPKTFDGLISREQTGSTSIQCRVVK